MYTKIIAGLTSLLTTVTHAAEITWQLPAAVTQAADILNPIGSTVHIAADFNNATGFASGDDNTINGSRGVRQDRHRQWLLGNKWFHKKGRWPYL